METGEFVHIFRNGSNCWVVITIIGTRPTPAQHFKAKITSLLCTPCQHCEAIEGVGGMTVRCLQSLTPHHFGLEKAHLWMDKNADHLQRCLEKRYFTMFPTTKEWQHTGNKNKAEIAIPVYNSCQIPTINIVIECCFCQKWFHVGPCVLRKWRTKGSGGSVVHRSSKAEHPFTSKLFTAASNTNTQTLLVVYFLVLKGFPSFNIK